MPRQAHFTEERSPKVIDSFIAPCPATKRSVRQKKKKQHIPRRHVFIDNKSDHRGQAQKEKDEKVDCVSYMRGCR